MNNGNKHIILTVKSHHQITIDPETIIRCESDTNYTTIHLKDEKYMVCKTLSHVEQSFKNLPTPFVRIHQSHLINLNRIKDIHKYKQWEITMQDESIIQVSRRKHKALTEQIEQHYITL